MIKSNNIQHFNINFDLLNEKSKKHYIYLPFVVELLITYFDKIYFVTYNTSKKSIVWDYKKKSKEKKWGLIQKYIYPKKIGFDNNTGLMLPLSKDRKVLSNIVSNIEFCDGRSFFISLSDEDDPEKVATQSIIRLRTMPVFVPQTELIMMSQGEENLGWWNSSIDKETLQLFCNSLINSIQEETIKKENYPIFLYNNTWK